MANPLDRTWYNTLVDDNGSGTTGTVWNKAAVDSLLDSVDASLAVGVDKTGTPAANQVAIFHDADTLKATPNVTVDPNGGLALNSPNFPVITLADQSRPVDGRLMRIVNTGGALDIRALLDSGASGGNPVSISRTGRVSLASGQLAFPSTQLPSTDLSTLDDYREGVFTPYLTATGGASGQVYLAQRGVFQKCGRWVQVEFEITLSVLGTFSGNILVAGFPFAADPTTPVTRIVHLDWHGLATTHIAVTGTFIPGNAHFELTAPTGAHTSSISPPLTAASMTANTSFYGNFRYATAN